MLPCTHTWSQPLLSHYCQLELQLLIKDGVVCRHYNYTPGPTSEPATVPIIPSSYQSTLLYQYHNCPSSGHLGADIAAQKIRQVHTDYWVGMLHDITAYCENCSVCQAYEQPSSQKAPLFNIPVGKPWKMITVYILQVPLSSQNNRDLLVIQEYFTKWVFYSQTKLLNR